MDYDSLLPLVGAFGRYQKILIGVVLVPTVFPCAFQAYSQLFIAATPNHWCRTPALDQWLATHPDLVRELSIPSTVQANGQVRYEQCSMFQRNYTEINGRFLEYVATGVGGNSSDRAPLVPCRDGWQYDRTLYPSTVVSEVSRWCRRAREKSVPTG